MLDEFVAVAPRTEKTMIESPIAQVLITSALLFLAGCGFETGPVHLRIQTGGLRYDDFVIQPVQEYGRFHGSKMVRMPPLVVASEEDLVVPKFSAGWTFQALLVSAYHPALRLSSRAMTSTALRCEEAEPPAPCGSRDTSPECHSKQGTWSAVPEGRLLTRCGAPAGGDHR